LCIHDLSLHRGQTGDGAARQTIWAWRALARRVPSASVMALITAAGRAMAPASPQPFMPSGLDGQGVTTGPTLKDGRSSARGMA
jgi:hypothetical protein